MTQQKKKKSQLKTRRIKIIQECDNIRNKATKKAYHITLEKYASLDSFKLEVFIAVSCLEIT